MSKEPYISLETRLQEKLRQETERYKNANSQRKMLEDERAALFDTLLNQYGLLLTSDGAVVVKDRSKLEAALKASYDQPATS